ncbi:MAG: cardiolipin synthase [Phycisphaerales bacterium]
MPDLISFGGFVLLVDWSLRVLFSVRIIMARRPVATSLAWLVVVLLMPFLGAAAYLLVGEVRLGERRRKRAEEVTRALEGRIYALWAHRHYEWHGPDSTEERFARFVRAIGGSPALRGNRLELLSDSDALLERLAADIDAAQSHCHLLYYIWQVSERTEIVVDALIRAAGRGVQCRVLVDAVGSREFLTSRQALRMRGAGVLVRASLGVNALRMLFSRIDLRNHRKIAAIDGRVAYTGSQNLNDSTFLEKARVGAWIDASVRVEGPAAQALDGVFLSDWMVDAPDGDRSIPDLDALLPPIEISRETGSVVQVLASGPGPAPESIRQALLAAIYAARDEIIMTTPYFVLDDASRLALQAAALRGVDVTVIVPRRSDSMLTAAAGRSHYLDLLEAGVKIRRYRPGLLHAKTVTIDRDMALIGSTNFDQRSFFLNFEITLAVYDSDFASTLRFLQRGYMEESQDVTLEAWKRRSSWAKAVDNSAQLLGPLL